jgi:hypothetical protein
MIASILARIVSSNIGMDAKPGRKRDRTRKFTAALADFRYRRIAPDHGHDALVKIPKGLGRSPRDFRHNGPRAIRACLLRDGR